MSLYKIQKLFENYKFLTLNDFNSFKLEENLLSEYKNIVIPNYKVFNIINCINKESNDFWKCIIKDDEDINNCKYIGLLYLQGLHEPILIFHNDDEKIFKNSFMKEIPNIEKVNWNSDLKENWEETILPKNQLGHFKSKDTIGIALGGYGRRYFGAKPFKNRLPKTY